MTSLEIEKNYNHIMARNTKGRVRNSYSGSSNVTINETVDLQSLEIINDGTGDITLKITDTDNENYNFIVKQNEAFDEIFKPFRKIEVTTTTAYRMITRML